ncbi:hypothetical protein LR48_Vigan10g104100 [Vigna angularis]|uniref:Uncharacterized protein n=1 Tax=Phaseolus angularis TaxID=3914 RepID=A0A0L9VK87_PHAAN|nr:hypothetical protein LR48_Vigan10g104100 [Vigna angularis]
MTPTTWEKSRRRSTLPLPSSLLAASTPLSLKQGKRIIAQSLVLSNDPGMSHPMIGKAISRRWGNKYLYSLLVGRPNLRFEQYFDKKNCFHSFSFQFFWFDVVFNHQLRTCQKLTEWLFRYVISTYVVLIIIVLTSGRERVGAGPLRESFDGEDVFEEGEAVDSGDSGSKGVGGGEEGEEGGGKVVGVTVVDPGHWRKRGRQSQRAWRLRLGRRWSRSGEIGRMTEDKKKKMW